MREIKFRGKRLDNGEWVYGFYCQSEEFFDNGGVGHMYREGTVTLHTIFNSANETHLVDPETVGQFTGLCDKNGQGIWEGDVIRRWGGECYCGCWEHNGTTVINDMINDCFMMGEGEFLEVIGNTTDSPDLLKEAK